jgi:hypothetical protein
MVFIKTAVFLIPYELRHKKYDVRNNVKKLH